MTLEEALIPAWGIHRSVDSARILTDLAVELGLPEAKTLAATGISPKQLRSPDTVIEARQELRLIANMVDGLGHIPALGVLAGERYHFNAFGALGFALVSSRTLLDAMETGLKYIQLTFAFSRIDLQDSGDRLLIRFKSEDLPTEVQQFIVERDNACFVTLQRDIFSRLSPLEAVHFSFEGPATVAPYETFYALRPKFGMPVNELVFDRSQLMEQIPQASELALKAAETQCEALLNQRLQRVGLSAKVRQHLATNAAEMPDMEAVALALNTIPRTLRRRLKQENTNFAELRDEVRQTLAEEYLSIPRLSVEQVAERLGYSGPTSFINAYKRWYGITPSAGRSRLK